MDNERLVVRKPAEQVAVLALLDEHDVANVGELRAAALALVEEGRSLIVDFEQTAFIDSSVIHAIMDLRREAEACGHEFALHLGAASRVKRTLEITGATDMLACFEDLETAIECLGSR